MPTVTVLGDGPHWMFPDAEIGWEDVWLRWKDKPGRRIYRDCFTVMSRGDVEGEVYLADLLKTKYPDYGFPGGDKYREVLRRFDAGEFAVEASVWHPREGRDDDSLYVNVAGLTRATVETALREALKHRGVKVSRFKWPRLKNRYCAWPISIQAANGAKVNAD